MQENINLRLMDGLIDGYSVLKGTADDRENAV